MMEPSDLIHAMHDTGGLLVLPKAYIPLLGVHATMLLTHLNSTIDNGFQTTEDQDGLIWHRQNVKWMCRQTALCEYELRKAKKELLGLGLIHIQQSGGVDRTTCWRVDKEKLARFAAFAYALFSATRPDNGKTIQQWWAFASKYPAIVEEFRSLYPRLHDFDPPHNANPASPPNAPILVSQAPPQKKPIKVEIKKHDEFQPKQKQGTSPKPCRFVEHWNEQPEVPKCKLGTKAYEQARAFFKAHQRYQAGNCSGFMLDPDEQARIGLDKVNRIPLDAERRGPNKIPMRPDSQMFHHIEKAAKFYQKEYAPIDKSKLPNNASIFFFNPYSRKYGRSSMFLERLYISPPVLLEDETRDGLWTKAHKFERMTYRILKRFFDFANNRDENIELSIRDHKIALSIATHYYDFYCSEMENSYSDIYASFPNYEDFLSWFAHVGQELVWDNMPMGAFDVGKDLWRKFLQSIGPNSMYFGMDIDLGNE